MTGQAERIASSIVAGLQDMAAQNVPPPAVCSQLVEVPHFFQAFERYASSLYKDDQQSWVQILPNYVGGDVLQIIKAFGYDCNYDHMKDRILKDFVKLKEISGQSYIDLLNLKKRDNESLRCFSIRLEKLAESIETNPIGCRALMLTALRSNLPPDVLFHVDLQMCLRPNFTVDEFLDASEAVSKIVKGQQSVTDAHNTVRAVELSDCLPGSPSGRVQFKKLCFRCGSNKHLANRCAGNKTCYLCRRKGHIARYCKNRSKKHHKKNPSTQTVSLVCGFCGLRDHVMIKCHEFLDFQKKMLSLLDMFEKHGNSFEDKHSVDCNRECEKTLNENIDVISNNVELWELSSDDSIPEDVSEDDPFTVCGVKDLFVMNEKSTNEATPAECTYLPSLDQYSVTPHDKVQMERSKYVQWSGKEFIPYKLNDLVLRTVKSDESQNRLKSCFDGPYYVKKIISPLTYNIEHAYSNKVLTNVHVSQLRPYYETKKSEIFKRSNPLDLDKSSSMFVSVNFSSLKEIDHLKDVVIK